MLCRSLAQSCMRRTAMPAASLPSGGTSFASSSSTVLSPFALFPSCRFINQTTAAATKEVPKTPDGHNPYEVMGLEVSRALTMEAITKQFKVMAVKCHPDRPGGSHEKMSDLNAALRLVKESHKDVMKRLEDIERGGGPGSVGGGIGGAGFGGATSAATRATREREYAQNGGLHIRQKRKKPAAQTATAAGATTEGATEAEGGQKTAFEDATSSSSTFAGREYNSPEEIAAAWDGFKAETLDNCDRMVHRLDLASEQCLFFYKTGSLAEITLRERWLRKIYTKHVWEDVHAMRQVLLKRGARTAEDAQLAEDMMTFATAVERQLKSEYARQAREVLRATVKINVKRISTALFMLCFVGYSFYRAVKLVWSNTFTVRFKKAMFAV